ncbi:MarR family winged helix-turn-helix transcriptional regulator [[Eubacterium] hominis]|uniref:MarR family winged helix-turn-helix transcriptional regulator n=1 Tax=[Eubacterium] hominis TaxID=2764325 RepID=UPI003A4DF7A7
MDEMEVVRRLTHLFYAFRKENATGLNNHPRIRHKDIMMLDAILSINDGDLVKMSDISTYLQVTPAAVSQFIKGYEKKGWVERIVLENDRRSVYIKVSDQAKEVMQTCEKHMTKSLYEFIEALGEEDAENFLRIMEKAVEFSKRKRENREKGACK